MRIKHKREHFRWLGCLVITAGMVLATGCFDFMGYDEAMRVERAERAKAKLPYYGTGVVTEVYRASSGEPTDVKLDFRPSPAPSFYTELLAVRTNDLVGKVEMRTRLGEKFGARVLEGAPQVGDLAIGVIHEGEFKKQKLDERRGEMP